MNMHAIRQVAKAHHINPGKLPKTELIRKIQSAEGNFECYATATDGECDQLDCTWRVDCLNGATVAPVAASSTADVG